MDTTTSTQTENNNNNNNNNGKEIESEIEREGASEREGNGERDSGKEERIKSEKAISEGEEKDSAWENDNNPSHIIESTQNTIHHGHDPSGIVLSDIQTKKEIGESSSELVHSTSQTTNWSQQKFNSWVIFKTKYLETLSPIHLVIAFVVSAFIIFICLKFEAPLGITIVFVLIALIPASLICSLQSKNIPKTFKCPGMPVIPLISITFNIYLMVSLSHATWIRLVVWLVIGLVVYFSYGIKHSKLGGLQ